MRRPSSRILVACCAALLVLTGCTTTSPSPQPSPPPDLPKADDAAAALATALTKASFATAPLSTPAEEAKKDVATITSGMDGVTPKVSVKTITYNAEAETATATMSYTWPVASRAWTYEVPATFSRRDNAWVLPWTSSLVHPELTDTTRLVRTYTVPKRGRIVGKSGTPLVKRTAVVKVGIDKTIPKKSELRASATQLAEKLGINKKRYVKRVLAAGKKDFVVAVVYRKGDVPSGVTRILGVRTFNDTAMLGLTRTFARSILGTVGPATAEQIKASGGAVVEGDIVGATGLQKRYDEQLRGKGGVQIVLRTRKGAPQASAGPSPSPSPTAAAASGATASSSPSVNAKGEPIVYEVAAENGEDVKTTINARWQKIAESILAGRGAASIAVVEPGTGRILVAANSTGSGERADATMGGYHPGSTMKAITALALMRHGVKPATTVRCDKTFYVPGWEFENYDDYPGGYMGAISLRTAFAQSCNTAFISQAVKRLKPGDLRSAGASLGVGTDYSAGFSANYGELPKPKDGFAMGQAAIGQQGVYTNVMDMAGVAASIKGKKTSIPYLVEGHEPTLKGKPLTNKEATCLQTLMKEVVKTGTAVNMRGYVQGAKTGTAEYSNTGTHAWMIAYTEDYAIAVWLHDGKHGNTDAGPLIQQFVRRAGS